MDPDFIGLVQNGDDILKGKLRIQGGVILRIEAMEAIEVAFPGDHEIHPREIEVIVFL